MVDWLIDAKATDRRRVRGDAIQTRNGWWRGHLTFGHGDHGDREWDWYWSLMVLVDGWEGEEATMGGLPTNDRPTDEGKAKKRGEEGEGEREERGLGLMSKVCPFLSSSA